MNEVQLDRVHMQWRSKAQPMSRRRFGQTLLIGLFTAAPRVALAQGTVAFRRIGVLEAGVPDTPEEIRRHGEPLRDLGWVEGKNLLVERRYANGRLEALQALAEQLVRAKVEVIVTGGTPATLAAKRATTTIPIVFRSAGDPVLLRIVSSLARPGGNVTGFSLSGPEVAAKRLTLLKELLPGVRRVGVLETSSNPYHRATRPQFEHACRSLGLEPIFVEIEGASEIGGAIASLASQRVQVVILPPDGLIVDHRLEIARAALKHRLPTMAANSAVAREGGALVSYEGMQAEEDQRAASFIDRILRGAKPGDLPVEQPTRFELVINLKTASALGVTIPHLLLMRADEVIK